MKKIFFCENKSPRTLSEAVYGYLKNDGFKGARRPFDHYRPTETDWYIVPSSELPFFKFGKFYFEWSSDRRAVNLGVICTKGLAPELAVVYPSKKGRRLIMEDDSWAFPFWLEQCMQLQLLPCLQKINAALPGITLKLRLHGAYIDDPGLFDPYTEEKKAIDCYELEVEPGNGTIRVVRALRQAMNLKILNRVQNEKTFAAALEAVGSDSFLWCNFFIGTQLQIANGDEEVIPIVDIAEKILAPLSIFVR